MPPPSPSVLWSGTGVLQVINCKESGELGLNAQWEDPANDNTLDSYNKGCLHFLNQNNSFIYKNYIDDKTS